jgi:hypothetical protein
MPEGTGRICRVGMAKQATPEERKNAERRGTRAMAEMRTVGRLGTRAMVEMRTVGRLGTRVIAEVRTVFKFDLIRSSIVIFCCREAWR